MKKILFLLLCICCLTTSAKDATSEQLVRRLYLDLYNRLPDESEYLRDLAKLKNENGFKQLSDAMLVSSEFQSYFATKLIIHFEAATMPMREKIYRRERLIPAVKQFFDEQGEFDYRQFLTKLVDFQTGNSSDDPLLLFLYEKDNAGDLTTRLLVQSTGVPLHCARCHDHKDYDEIKYQHFWQTAAFFGGSNFRRINNVKDLENLEKRLKRKKAGIELVKTEDLAKLKEWIKSSKEKAIEKELAKEAVRVKKQEAKSSKKNKITKKKKNGQVKKPVLTATQKAQRAKLSEPAMVFVGAYETSKKVSVGYEIKGKKERAWPKFPFPIQGLEIDATISPRANFAKWLTHDKNQWTDKAMTNWLSKWVYGHSFVEPMTDLYGSDFPRGEWLKHYSTAALKFKPVAQMRQILQHPIYRFADSPHVNTKNFSNFTERKAKRMTSDQFINSFINLNNVKIKERQKNNLLAEALNFFPVPDDESLEHYNSGLTQTLFTMNHQILTAHIAKVAREAYLERKNLDVGKWLQTQFRQYFTRDASEAELALLMTKIDIAEKDFRKSGFREVLWAIINSPEAKIY